MTTDHPDTVFMVDDEPAVRRLVRLYLDDHGYRVIELPTAEALLDRLSDEMPRAVILDIGLPGISGIEATRVIREWSNVPVLIVSVRGNEDSIVEALDVGADDYLVKPFSLGELAARLRAAMRARSGALMDEQLVEAGAVVVDLVAREVSVSGTSVALTPTEYDLMCVLARNAGRVVTHKRLLKEVWGISHHEDAHVVRVTVSNLRAKLGSVIGHKVIINEPRIGYRLTGDH